MHRLTPTVQIGGVPVTLWIVGVVLGGIACRGDDVTEPVEVSAHADGSQASVTTTAGALSVRQMSLGFAHTCAATTDQRGYCWGGNSNGQLGDGHPFWRRLRPLAVAGGLAFVQVSANEKHSCGVTADNTAYCWGWNRDGRLGDGTLTNRVTPVRVTGGLKFRLVTAGWDHTCGISTGVGQVYCWGNNTYGQLGIGVAGGNRRRPHRIALAFPFSELSAGRSYTCGLARIRRPTCWGFNGTGALGDGTTINRLVPIPAASGTALFHLTAGPNGACGLSFGNRPLCWGLFDNILRLEPVPVEGEFQFEEIQVGGLHACGLTMEGEAYCWGYNGHGRLGDGTNTARRAPTRVAGNLVFSGLDLGYHHSCGVTTGNVAYCWGWNGLGQLGDGTFTDRWTPVPIASAR